jgi:hypothetical protein
MTDIDVIHKAADAFKRRDQLAAELRAADEEIKGLVKQYSIAMKMWGVTPTMLRHAVDARLGVAA